MGCKVLLVASIGAVGNNYQIGQFGGLIFYPPYYLITHLELKEQVRCLALGSVALTSKIR